MTLPCWYCSTRCPRPARCTSPARGSHGGSTPSPFPTLHLFLPPPPPDTPCCDACGGGLVPTRIYTYRSLGVEEQFYFLFPGMLLAMYPQHVLKAVGRGSKAASQPETLEAEVSSASSGCGGRPMVILGLSALLSLVAYIVAVRLAFPGARDDKFWFYNTPFRFWELASGALLYLGLSLHPDAFAPIQQAVCVSLPQTTTPSPLSPLPSPLSPGPRLPPCPHPSTTPPSKDSLPFCHLSSRQPDAICTPPCCAGILKSPRGSRSYCTLSRLLLPANQSRILSRSRGRSSRQWPPFCSSSPGHLTLTLIQTPKLREA